MSRIYNEEPSAKLISAMAALWEHPESAWEDLTTTPLYSNLLDALAPDCADVRRFGGMVSMSRALASLGLPCGLPASKRHLALSAEAAAERLNTAIRATDFTRVHLMPLDMADTLPALCFGNATVGRLTAQQLRQIVDLDRMERIYPDHGFDLDQFAQFQWLVVRENVPINRGPGGRELHSFRLDPMEDYGRIEPHRGIYSEAVETALFWLALAPWEQLTESPDIDWRGMQIPWTYTVDHDLFAAMKRPPSSDTLSWEDSVSQDEYGHPFEVVRPVSMWLSDGSADTLRGHFSARLEAVSQLPRFQLFKTPVIYFFTRAFLVRGIDEFMAHMLVIEAALGLPEDYQRKSSTGAKAYESYGGATKRVSARLLVMLEPSAASDYDQLFKVRSEFLHGRSMQVISGLQRIKARSLARRVVDALVAVSQNDQNLERGTFLDDLLDRGVVLDPTRPKTA
ncbi:hypothetical protein VC290_19095 [Xanthomonas campestris]|uniref:hypothetical protein n=1 Tax=Xanthomonas campestris TaxID=339 RepID=UPI002B23E6FD|nr:hypothetical protein [Xanthomonas campestris]MEA9482418.1 hypothetical protein [Xanthomonas campestris]